MDLVDNKGLRLSLALCVVCMSLPSGRIACVPWCVFTLLIQGVSTLMYSFVASVSAMPYVGLDLCGFPLHLLHSLLFCVINSSTVVL